LFEGLLGVLYHSRLKIHRRHNHPLQWRTGLALLFPVLATALAPFAVSQVKPAGGTEWNYDVYRKTYPEQVSTIHTSQSGKESLEPAHDFSLEGQTPAKKLHDQRKQILAAWRDLLGPSNRNPGPLRARTLEITNFAACTRAKVEYEGDPGEPIRAWLFIPKNLNGKAPAVICLHQTVPEGKDQAAGLTTSPELAFGPLLAQRGYVTLCPDAICFGERYQVGGNFYCHYGDAVRIYQGNAGRSILSKMADDTSRAVDYLCSLPQVDKKRIGSIGHSHGGYGTLFGMAFDDRIKVGVVSCGFTSFRSDPTPERWYRRTALIPRLGTFEGHMKDTPVDFHHLFAAISPRPLFISAAMKDRIFPGVGDVNWIRKDVSAVYSREKVPDAFQLYAFEGEHAFTPEACDRAWAFLDSNLKSQNKSKAK
jgi:dienelactone hydrolase